MLHDNHAVSAVRRARAHLVFCSPLPSSPAGQAVSITKVWEVVMYGFEAMWPAGRTELDGRNMGDVWEHSALTDDGSGWSKLVPFHKLSQWMTYSLMEPLQVLIVGLWLQTVAQPVRTYLALFKNARACGGKL